MSKVTKSDLNRKIERQETRIDRIVRLLAENGYYTSNGDVERHESDTAKELLEVDLSSELTGSELCKAMLARGDKYVMCAVNDDGQEDTLLDGFYAAIQSAESGAGFYGYDNYWSYATPINNQGEPLTQAEAGL